MSTSITCISDLHGFYKNLVIEPTDILICVGDISGHSFKEDVENFNLWFNQQPAKYKVLVAGNHDSYLAKCEDPQVLFTNLQQPYYTNPTVYLQDECVTIEGINTYCNFCGKQTISNSFISGEGNLRIGRGTRLERNC